MSHPSTLHFICSVHHFPFQQSDSAEVCTFTFILLDGMLICGPELLSVDRVYHGCCLRSFSWCLCFSVVVFLPLFCFVSVLVCFLVSPQFSAHNVLCLVLWFAVVPTYEDGRGSSR